MKKVGLITQWLNQLKGFNFHLVQILKNLLKQAPKFYREKKKEITAINIKAAIKNKQNRKIKEKYTKNEQNLTETGRKWEKMKQIS